VLGNGVMFRELKAAGKDLPAEQKRWHWLLKRGQHYTATGVRPEAQLHPPRTGTACWQGRITRRRQHKAAEPGCA
jgi:hypothetical protein